MFRSLPLALVAAATLLAHPVLADDAEPDIGSAPLDDTALPTRWGQVGLPGPGIGLSGGFGARHRPRSLVQTRWLVELPSLELAFPIARRMGLALQIPVLRPIAQALLGGPQLDIALNAYLMSYRRPNRGGFDLAVGPGLGLWVENSVGFTRVHTRVALRFGLESPSVRGRFRAGVLLEPWLSIGAGSGPVAPAAGVNVRLLARWHWVRRVETEIVPLSEEETP